MIAWRENHLGEKLGEQFIGTRKRGIRSKRMNDQSGGGSPCRLKRYAGFSSLPLLTLDQPADKCNQPRIFRFRKVFLSTLLSSLFFETANRGQSLSPSSSSSSVSLWFFQCLQEIDSRKTIISKIGEEGNMVFFFVIRLREIVWKMIFRKRRGGMGGER